MTSSYEPPGSAEGFRGHSSAGTQDRLSLENRITTLETTISNFRWFVGLAIGMSAALTIAATFLINLLINSN